MLDNNLFVYNGSECLKELSLTSDNDLVLAKIDNYYLCLAEPSKRKYNLNWYDANKYCKSLGKNYYLPTLEELNIIIYINKGSLSLAEAYLYSDETCTLDFISKGYSRLEHPYWPWIWSSSGYYDDSYAWLQHSGSGDQGCSSKSDTTWWTLPVRRIPA